jgi:hypothetical protein
MQSNKAIKPFRSRGWPLLSNFELILPSTARGAVSFSALEANAADLPSQIDDGIDDDVPPPDQCYGQSP